MRRLLVFVGFVALAALVAPRAYSATTLAPDDLHDFQLVSANAGWVWLANDLFWTHDDGRTWTRITPPHSSTARILAVHFLDARDGWVLFIESNATFTLARTRDGCATWQTQSLALFASNDPNALVHTAHFHFLDAQTGWLAFARATSSNFSAGALFHTTDGGATWHARALPIGAPVVFADAMRGWTAGGATGDALYRTTDGGFTWSPDPFTNLLRAPNRRLTTQLPRFDHATNGILPMLITEDGVTRVELYRTRDAGTTWQRAAVLPLDRSVEADERVPLAMLDAQAAFVIAPRARQIARLMPGETLRRTSNDALIEGIVALKMASSTRGWAKYVSGACIAESPDKTRVRCQSEARLLRTNDGGVAWQTIALPDAPNVRAPSGGTQIVQGQGFDKCEVPTLAQLQTWWNASPYRAVNLYIGGSSRACANSALSNSYVSQMSAQGWKFIPTWVGPQAACSGYASRMSSDPTTAYQQGVSEANSAADVAANLGLSNSVLYYDLEAYDTSNDTCRNAAKSFISGWSAQARARGYQAGVYGSACASALNDFISIPNVPNVIWPAHWIYSSYNSGATVWSVACIPDSNWSNHQRIRQYAGGHNETWGGLTLNIDSNALDGVVATYGSAPTCSYDSNQIVLYANTGYGGACKTLSIGDYPNPSAMGFANDDAESVRIGSNVQAILCRDDNYSGGCVTLTADTDNLDSTSLGGNQLSSVRVQTRADSAWRVEYFSDKNLGSRCYEGWENSTYIFKKWDGNAPAGSCPSDNFSARFTRNVNFSGGDYSFHLQHDDGARLFIDGQNVVNAWWDGEGGHDGARNLSGMHEVKIEYYDQGGFAGLEAWWRGAGYLPHAPTFDPYQWRAEYFGNRALWGTPALVQNEGSGSLNHDWGGSGVGYGMPSDNFSARFQRTVGFECGRYRFNVHVDDGVRVWVGNTQILDAWRDQVADFTPEIDLPAGDAVVKVEYYENGGNAAIQMSWTKISSCPTPPSAPSLNTPANGAVLNRTDSVTLTWFASSGANDYYAEFWGGPSINLNSGWITSLNWMLGAQWAGSYQWRVKARNSAGESGWSETRALTIKLGAPSNLSANALSQTQINLTWSASADAPANIDGYRIYRNGNALTTVGGGTAYADTSVQCGTRYDYYVKAYKGSTESEASNTASATTLGCPPATPTGFRVSAVTPNSITLQWNNVADETGYKIYRWGYDGSQWRFIYHASVGANITTFTDRGLNSASDYYYELSAYNAHGESAHTTWIKGTTAPALLFLPLIQR